MVERWNPWTDAAVMPMAESTHSHGNPTLALTNLSGTTASASNGLTLSLSAAAPGAGGGFAAQGSGTYTQNTGTIQFANSNGITFGLTANQMTASHDGLTTAQPPGAYLTTAMLSNASSAFAGINGAITGGSFTLNTAGASINLPAYITTAAQADHSHGNPTLALTNLAGTTASASNGLTISLSHNISTAAVPDHSHGNPTLNLTNIAGTTASASNGLTLSLSVAAPGAGSGTALNLTNLAGTLSANTAGISLSMSAAAPGAGGGFAAQGSGVYTQNSGTIAWANSNRVTFGLSTNQMTASIDAAGTGFTTASTAGSVLVGTQGTNGLSLGVPAWLTIAAGAGDGVNIISASGNTTGTLSSQSTGTIVLAGGPNVTLSQSSNTISISVAAPGGGAGATLSYYEPPWANSGRATNSSLGQNTLYFMPFDLPFYLSASRINFYISISGVLSAGNSTGTCRQGFGYALYTRDMTGAASQTLSLLTSYSVTHLSHSMSSNTAYRATHYFGLSNVTSHSTRQTGLSTSNATTYLVSNINGPRVLALPLNSVMTPGRYWLGVAVSTVTGAAMTNNLSVQMTSVGVVGAAYHFGSASAATNASVFRAQQGWGFYSATSAAFPNSIAYSTDAIRAPVAMTMVHFDIRGFATSTNQL